MHVHLFLAKLMILGLILGLMMFMGCSGTKSTTDNTVAESNRTINSIDPNDREGTEQELIDLLRKVPGIYISGYGANVNITIRGATRIQGDNEPLYVIDNTPVGRDYNAVASAVNTANIASIRVLKGPEASRFGARGSNGVILIRTKTK